MAASIGRDINAFVNVSVIDAWVAARRLQRPA
jgi:hypothetical protein